MTVLIGSLRAGGPDGILTRISDSAVVALLFPGLAIGQTSGAALVVLVQGGNSAGRFGGFAGGGGVLLRNRVGVDGDVALLVDNSDERDGVLALSVGGSLHFPARQTTRRLVPLVVAGFTRLGDAGGWHVGGGTNYWIRRWAALRLEFRAMVPTIDYRRCSMNSRNTCALASKVWFLRAGMTFGGGK